MKKTMDSYADEAIEVNNLVSGVLTEYYKDKKATRGMLAGLFLATEGAVEVFSDPVLLPIVEAAKAHIQNIIHLELNSQDDDWLDSEDGE